MKVILLLFFHFKRKTIQKEWVARYQKYHCPVHVREKKILTELPELIEQDFFINLSSEQQKEYDMVFDFKKRKNPLDYYRTKKICNFSENLKSSK